MKVNYGTMNRKRFREELKRLKDDELIFLFEENKIWVGYNFGAYKRVRAISREQCQEMMHPYRDILDHFLPPTPGYIEARKKHNSCIRK